MLRVASYVRYSSENQRMESIESQLRASEEYCNRHQYQIVRTYSDRAKSATTDKRPEFQKMIKDSEQGLFDIVLVHKLDRFARNKYDSALYKKKLKNNGVRVVSVTENLDDSPESIILESVIEGMAEYYSKNLAREVMKGLKENAYQCKHNGGIPPLGYDVNEEKKYVINEKEAEAVKLIFQMYLDDYTSGDMIRKLNSYGFRTKKETEWTKNSLTSIVRNEKYKGIYIYNRTITKDNQGHRNNHKNKNKKDMVRIEGSIPQIIDNETFDKVQEKLKDRKRTSPSASKTSYLLAGLVKCSCGSAMHGNRRRAKRKTSSGITNKPEYVSYRCGCRKTKSSIVCNNSEIRKEYLEEYILHELETHIFNDNSIKILTNKVNEYIKENDTHLICLQNTLEKELLEVNEKIKNIINAVSMGFASIELKNELDKLNSKKHEIEVSIRNVGIEKSNDSTITKDEVTFQLQHLKTFVIERNYPEIKTFIKSFVKEIVVNREGIEVTFNPLFIFSAYLSDFQIFSSIKRNDLYTPLKRCMNINLNKKEMI